jgi:SAM-dependent methyltransferase
MASKSEIHESATAIEARIAELREVIAQDSEILRRGGVVFPHNTIGANLGPIFELLGKSGNEHLLLGHGVSHVADIGCGNGDLAFTLSRCGYTVTAVDYSDSSNQSPYIASQIARKLELPIAIVDFSVDRSFQMSDLRNNCVHNEHDSLPQDMQHFDFSICVGLLYHLKSPYAFIESLARITRYCIVGTWIFTHLSPETPNLSQSVVYLLDDRELNGDPTNYWIFSDVALARLFRRCSLEVLDKLLIPNNPQGIGTPNQMELLMRGFYLLRSSINTP